MIKAETKIERSYYFWDLAKVIIYSPTYFSKKQRFSVDTIVNDEIRF